MEFGYVIIVIIQWRSKVEKHLLKITCYTPKGKSVACEKEWKKQFPSFKKPIKKGIPNDSEFFWIYDFKELKKMYTFQKKCLLAEGGIRKLYRFLIRFFNRCNRLMNKSAWSVKKVRNWMVKRWKKTMKPGDNSNDDQVAKIEAMDDEQFKEYIKIEDLEDMQKFLEKDSLILAEYLGEGEDVLHK